MAAKRSAGAKLRAKLNAALRATGVAGAEFTELEQEAIDAAVQAADRAEKLREIFDAELAGDARPTTLARLSAEARHCERRVVDLVAMVKLEPEPVKSPRHQRAARARWDRRDKANEPRVVSLPMERAR